MAAASTLSSLPISAWIDTISKLHEQVQQLNERVKTLEAHSNIPVVKETKPKKTRTSNKSTKSANPAKEATETTKKRRTSNKSAPVAQETAKRGRKPNTDVPLSQFVREGEYVIIRIPLGDRKFDTHTAQFRGGEMVLEDGQSFSHPTTLVGVLAKKLEDIGERSSECSKSMNGWGLCQVVRDGKRVTLESLRKSLKEADAPATTEQEEAEEETEEVAA